MDTGSRELCPGVHWAQRHRRPDYVAGRRRIYDYELIYVEHGELHALIGDQEYAAPAGSLLLVPPGAVHTIRVVSPAPACLLGIHFDFFNEREVSTDQDIVVDERRVREGHFCAAPILRDFSIVSRLLVLTPPKPVATLMEQLILAWQDRKPGYALICRGLLLQIFGLLQGCEELEKRSPHPKYQEAVAALARQLESGYRRAWSNEDMARTMNVHKDYMSRLFKAQMGVSPQRFLMNIRHMAAKRMLRETDDTVEAVARRVGYEDIHYFSRLFKRLEGITSQQYRRLSRM